nr:hypothetical protein [Spirochaetota bacterium]
MGNDIAVSRKVIVITENKRILMSLRNAFVKRDLEIETRFLNLTSLSIIRKVVANVKNTSPIRTELFKFIREVGIPYSIVIDYEIDLKLDAALDPDRKKLLRTLLISHVILSRGKGFELLRGNFLILADDRHYDSIKQYEDMPIRILDLLNTKNDVVNSFIKELRENPVLFNRIFYFKVINVNAPPDVFQDEMNEYLNKVEERVKQGVFLKGGNQASVIHDTADAGSVVFRVDQENVFIDGEERKLSGNQDYENIPVNEIHIVGSWTSRNKMEVGKKLNAMILNLQNRDIINSGKRIVLAVGEKCVVDGSTASSLAQLLIQDLKNYTNIKLKVCDKSIKILENSKGFSMIRE